MSSNAISTETRSTKSSPTPSLGEKVLSTKQALCRLKMSRQSFYNYAFRLKVLPQKTADLAGNVVRSSWREKDVSLIVAAAEKLGFRNRSRRSIAKEE